MSVWVGLGGVAGHACAAVASRDEVLGVCEQERVTRVRAAGFNRSGLPDEAIDEILRRVGRQRTDVARVALAENVARGSRLGQEEPLHYDHHFAHACTAFLTSPHESATILVCDDEPPHTSVWSGDGSSVARVEWEWRGPGFADLYSECAEAFGFSGPGREQRLEALARFDSLGRDQRVTSLFGLEADRLRLAPGWRAELASWTGTGALRPQVSVLASAIQGHIDELLIEFLRAVRRRTSDTRCLCVGGSLFENSHFNSTIRTSGVFDEVFVPVNPGNAGLAVGTSLLASGPRRERVTPFLGPSYTAEEIKTTFDNCKLTYESTSGGESVDVAVDALRKGQLVAWVEGPMEWGPRALGARSILANPFAPYVLENLNRFLKQREAWRGYALSALDSAVTEHFHGPSASPFMECDYVPRDPRRFERILPAPRSALRVQTVESHAPPLFRTLIEKFGSVTGVPVVVNTSFNGFHEPIVCSPRDAVRVFFGTGIDLLVFEGFLIRK
jgi:carbamoyltransferase